MRLGLSFSVVTVGLGLGLGACGGGGSSTDGGAVDAPGQDIGFAKPAKSLQANMKNTDTSTTPPTVTWSAIGAPDLTCLNTPNADVATTVAVALSSTVKDFQNQTPVAQASVTAFSGVALDSPFGAAVMSDEAGLVTVNIPQGQKRFGLKMTQADSIDTLLLNQIVAPDMAAQTIDEIQIVSNSTVTVIPALIGKTRTPGTGVAAGAVRDCQHHELSNFVVDVSSTSGTASPIDGAFSYYFALSPELPVVHHSESASNQNGLFVSIQLPVTPTAYIQAWGYETDADLAADKLTLISELAVPVLADTVVTGSFEPVRQ